MDEACRWFAQFARFRVVPDKGVEFDEELSMALLAEAIEWGDVTRAEAEKMLRRLNEEEKKAA